MSNRFQPVRIHASFRAEALRNKRIASLKEHAIDHGFHYAGVRQAELWLKVHQAHAPGSVDPEFERLYRAAAANLAQELAGQAVHVIGLGSGGGEKETWVLNALHQHGCPLRYTPVDISPELALMSAEQARASVEAHITPVVGDLSLLADADNWLEADPATVRVYTAFGLTPNFPPSYLLGLLNHSLRPSDHLLLSANLAPTTHDDDSGYPAAVRELLYQYDNPETRTWLHQVLIDWGIADKLGPPEFQVAELEDIAGFFAYSTWLEDTHLDWEEQPFTAHKGDRLRLFFSLRYTPKRLAKKLEALGLIMGPAHIASNGQEGVWQIHR